MLNLLSLLNFMFGGNKKKEKQNTNSSFSTPAPNNRNTSGSTSNMNRIGKGTTIEGDIDAEGSIRIEGRIKGNLNCKARVIIGETGVIEGTVTCQEMEVMGKFNGTLDVKDTLILRSTAKVEGTTTYNKLMVDSGAVLSGTAIHRATTQKMNVSNKTKVVEPKAKAV